MIEGSAGYACRNNACYKLTTCNGDSDCAIGQICALNPDGESKSCIKGCTQPTDCPIAQGCNNDPQHPHCTPTCSKNNDCPLNSVCDQGACKSSLGSCPQTCQATEACAIGSGCSSNGCCVAGNLDQLCHKGCTASTATNCFYVPGKACNNQNDCNVAFPGAGTACQPWGGTNMCVGTLGFKACSGDTDCSYKGFHCQFFAGSATTICLAVEDAAVTACYVGHP